jgi:hypothetical protein
MRQAPEDAVPPLIVARWWAELTRTLAIRGDERAMVVAEEAHARRLVLGDAEDTLHAASWWLRSVPGPGPDMDRALAAVEAAALAAPEPSSQRALLWRGSLGLAASRRRDMQESLRQHEAELVIAKAQRWVRAAEAAETNVISRLPEVGRGDEAIERGMALLATMADDNGNLPWLLLVMLDALVSLGRAKDGIALAARAWQSFVRFDVPNLLPQLARLAVLAERFDDGARLLGHARQAYETRGIALNRADIVSFDGTTKLLHKVLGEDRTSQLEQEGRQLSDEAAGVTLLGA